MKTNWWCRSGWAGVLVLFSTLVACGPKTTPIQEPTCEQTQCIKGSTICDSRGNIRYCRADAKGCLIWQAGEACPGKKTCVHSLKACAVCQPGSTKKCFTGDPTQGGVGQCQMGLQTCRADGMGYSECKGEGAPSEEVCDQKDNDCDGQIDEGKNGAKSVCEYCGDGIRQSKEQCDDGNDKDGDGCSSQCKHEGVVTIPAGSFMMGASSGDTDAKSNEKPARKVNITYSYLMTTTEITQQQYKQTIGTNPSMFHQSGAQRPVEHVSWHEALYYANKRSIQEGLEPCFDCKPGNLDVKCSLKAIFKKVYTCTGWRLPTEAEWEYAARAGSKTALYGDIDKIAWYIKDNVFTTQNVATKQPNAWGLYDMLGNVYEWTWDVPAYYEIGEQTNPIGTNESEGADIGKRITRGGSYRAYTKYVRSSARTGAQTYRREKYIGFRIVRSLPQL